MLNLDQRGTLALSARAPAGAERVVVTVRAGSTSADVEVSERLELGVPAGSVMLHAEARTSSAVLAEEDRTVEVARGETVEVSFDFDAGETMDAGAPDSGVPEVRSFPIAFDCRPRTQEISGSTLRGPSEQRMEGAYLSFRNDAESELSTIATISVAEVSLTLALAETQGVGTLDDLWDQTIFVALVSEDGSDQVDVASGTASAGATTADLTGLDADLGVLSSELGNGRFSVVVHGNTPRTGSDDFDAHVRAAIVFVAR